MLEQFHCPDNPSRSRLPLGYVCLLAMLSAALAIPGASPSSTRAEQAPWTVIGFTQGGLPLVVHPVGTGVGKVLLLGGQHGGPEANTIELAERLLAHFQGRPEEIPGALSLHVITVANPDGAAVGSRQFLSGVDPNRNWASQDWQSDAWDSNARYRLGLGGPYPFSEQETRALRDWVLAARPELIINYHSAGGFLFAGRSGQRNEVAEAYAQASGYYRPQPSAPGRGSSVLGYRATGSMGAWLGEQDLRSIFIELTDAYSPEFERNLAGLRAALPVLASLVGPD